MPFRYSQWTVDFLVYHDGILARNSKIDWVLNKYKSAKYCKDVNQVYLSEEEIDEAKNNDENDMEEEESSATTVGIQYDPSPWENEFYETDEGNSILANL